MDKTIKILVVEDEPLIAEDIEGFLHEAGYKSVSKSYDAISALTKLKENEYDFVFLDIDLNSNLDGVNIAEFINLEQQIPFAFITSFSDQKTLDRVKLTNPVGYVVKPFKEADIFTCIEIGYTTFYDRYKKVESLSIETINKKLTTKLTAKEFEVLVKLFEGKNNAIIAEELFVSLNTIKTHLKNIFIKINVKSRTEALTFLRTL